MEERTTSSTYENGQFLVTGSKVSFRAAEKAVRGA